MVAGPAGGVQKVSDGSHDVLLDALRERGGERRDSDGDGAEVGDDDGRLTDLI